MSEPISTPIVFDLSDDGAKPVVEQTLAPSFNVGIHLVRLADFGVRLALGKQYRWFVLLAFESKRRAWDIRDLRNNGVLRNRGSSACPLFFCDVHE